MKSLWIRSFAKGLKVVALVSLCGALQAQPNTTGVNFPSKPIKIVVPFGAGGVADLTARVIAQKMSEGLGQPVVVENRPGAGGVVAADVVARQRPMGTPCC